MQEQNQQIPWIDAKYVRLLDGKFERFKVQRSEPILANFRCPYCGDSQISKWKARGFLYTVADKTVNYMCHNCGTGHRLRTFLNDHAPTLYRDYVMETFGKDTPRVVDVKIEKKNIEKIDGLMSLDKLPDLHVAVSYWRKRMLPTDRMADAYYSESYYKWVDDYVDPGKFGSKKDTDRLVFVVRDHESVITGFSGRSLNGESPKYVHASLLGHKLGFFGSHRQSPDQVRYLCEGPTDSMMLPGAIALMGANRETDSYPNAAFVLNNEPRNKNIVARYRDIIESGRKIVVWPGNFKYDDLNTAVMDGMPLGELRKLVDANIKQGPLAKMAFGNWAR